MVRFELAEYHRNLADGDLIEDLRRLAVKLKANSITGETYELNGGKYSRQTFHRRFGSWNKALEAAGLEIVKRYKIPDEEMFANLETVWRHLGRQPRHAEVCRPLSLIAASAYDKRFGSWRKALETFVNFINTAEADGEAPGDEPPGAVSADAVQAAARGTRYINWRTRFLVMRRDDFKCQYCGRSPANNPGLELHIDHVQAWSKDGPTTMDNLKTACNVCNIGKSNLDATEGP